MKLKVAKFLGRFGYGRTAPLQQENARLKTALTKEQCRSFAAAQNNRLLEEWLTTRTTINNLLDGGIGPLRARSREMVRENDYAKAFRRMVINNVVGPDGFKNEPDIRDDNGKIDQKAVDIIKKAWDKWSKKQFCTVSEDACFHDLCTHLIGESPAAGGFLVRMVQDATVSPDNPFRFSLQTVDLDQLDEQKSSSWNGSTFTRMGVEMNGYRKRLFYHIRTDNPYDNFRMSGAHKTIPVDARAMLHCFIPLEMHQVRELPWFHTSMIGLHMIGGYNEAALVAARAGAQKMGFLKSMPDANGNYTGDSTDSDGNAVMDSAPGQIERLPRGMDFAAWDPKYPHSEHGPFNKAVLRGIAAGLGVSYNSLANDLEGVNYSSIRAGLLDERDQWKLLQRWFCQSFLEPVFERWLNMAILTGQVALPQYKFEKFNRPCFMGRRWPWVDPLKDIQASILGVENGFQTRTDIIAENGGAIEEVFATSENEKELAEKHGLKFSGLKGYTEAPEAAKTTGGAKTETATE
jgi:lambda family phage portal protein